MHSTDFAKGLKNLSCHKELWRSFAISHYISHYSDAGLSNAASFISENQKKSNI